MSNNVEEAIAYAGSPILTLNCIVAGLASQLKAEHGTAAIEAAHAFATSVARAYPTHRPENRRSGTAGRHRPSSAR